MVLGTFTSVFAAETTTKAEAKKAEAGEKVEKVVGKDNKIQYVIDKKLVEGYEDGTYGLDKNIKRSEITRLLVLANGNEELSKKLQGSMKIYSDVDTKHWANGVITVGTTVPSDANGIAMLAGYPDGSFGPEKDVTYAELAKMLVVLTKEDLTADMVKNAIWASSWMTWAAELGILEDVTITDSNKAANRADAFTMVYNALYRMKEFKRVPANETRGIVSNLTSGKLTLNQDDKKVYDVTNSTVIVDGINARRQIISVSSLNNLDLYKGSLVRILTNDKNEVTHIIELGNPEDLAKNNPNEKAVNNSVWEGVADTTVETDYYGEIRSLKGLDQKLVNRAYAEVKLNSTNTKGDSIIFRNLDKQEDVTLKINDKTEVYVANPYNNIMREVKDINEALSLIGFHNYDGYKIPNVYAGFDNDGHKSAIKGFDSDRNTAKVIVFNVVSKDNDGDLYRVINSSSSKFSTTLEDTDGKLYDRDNVLNKANFPLNYGDLLDVIETRGDSIVRKLDHSDKRLYPVVRVVEVFDKDEVRVEDRFGNESLLYFADADIFNAKQYKDLAKGDYLQFRAKDKDSRAIEIVSILDDTKDTRDLFNESGSLLNVVKGIEGKTATGIILAVKDSSIEVRVEEANWDAGLAHTNRFFEVDKADLEQLKAGMDVTFKVDSNKYQNKDYAYDFKINSVDQPRVDAQQLRDELANSVEPAIERINLQQLAEKDYNKDNKTLTVTILDGTAKISEIKNTGAMVALQDLATAKNLTAFEVNGKKVETAGRSTEELKEAITLFAVEALKADDGNLDTLSDLKGKTISVKVYLATDKATATDTYTVNFK